MDSEDEKKGREGGCNCHPPTPPTALGLGDGVQMRFAQVICDAFRMGLFEGPKQVLFEDTVPHSKNVRRHGGGGGWRNGLLRK